MYLEYLAAGWSLSVSRAKSGLKNGRVDYESAMRDPRVVSAQAERREQLIEKQRNKIG